MRTLFTPVLVISLLSGCASSSLRYAGAKTAATGGGLREAATIDFSCTARPNPEAGGSPIVAAVVGIAVDAVISGISAALARAQKARTGAWSASSSADLNNCSAGRLTIIRGIFDGDTGDLMTNPVPAFQMTADVMIDTGATPAVLTITPTRLDYAETSAASRGKGRKEVTVSFALTSVGAAKPAAGGEAGGAAAEAPKADASIVNLGRLEIGKTYQGFNTSVALSTAIAPRHNVTVLVTESEDASVALAALAAAFEKNKDALGTALKDAITDALGSGKKK